MAKAARPLRIWAVSDGRAGIEAQALGLAEAIARLRPAHIAIKRIGWKSGLGRLPWQLIPPSARTGDPIEPPYPHIWIAAGRATPLDWAIAATGLVLLALGLRAALLHVTRV